MYICTHYVNVYVRKHMEFIFEFKGQLKCKNSYTKFVDSNTSQKVFHGLATNEWNIACGSWPEDTSQNNIVGLRLHAYCGTVYKCD